MFVGLGMPKTRLGLGMAFVCISFHQRLPIASPLADEYAIVLRGICILDVLGTALQCQRVLGTCRKGSWRLNPSIAVLLRTTAFRYL
jgi:hypothetical protein